jgi:hypothetical protein
MLGWTPRPPNKPSSNARKSLIGHGLSLEPEHQRLTAAVPSNGA